MKLAIMQPYVFPYIGYFQLIAATDKFIVYDDVTFIKQGWINRNNILINGKPHLFTIPLEKASSFISIRDTELNRKFYPNWAKKFIKTLEQNYRKAPCFSAVMSLVEETLSANNVTAADVARASILNTINYLSIGSDVVPSSSIYQNNQLTGQDRILDICKKEHAHSYINAIGGQSLYSKEEFLKHGVELKFIKPIARPYKQFPGEEFVPWLSIIDILMYNEPLAVKQMLEDYELI